MENSVPVVQKIPTLHHPEGIEPGRIFFHEEQVRNLILDYQREPSPETWQAIVMACLPLIESLIRSHNFHLYEDKDALKNECIIKLFKAIQHYDPARGRAFSVLSVAITRFLFSYVAMIRTRSRRLALVGDEILERYEGAGHGRTELPEELAERAPRILHACFFDPGNVAALLSVNGFTRALPGSRRRCFARLMDVFAGLTVTFPSKSAFAKMRRNEAFLNGLSDAQAAFSAGPLSARSEHQLLGAVLEGHHTEVPLYASSEET
jgi:hypothetical protein